MSAPRYRTWRFAHPDFEMAELSGLRISPTGRAEMVEEHASIRALPGPPAICDQP